MAQGSIATLIRRTRQCDFNTRPYAQPAEPSHSASTARPSTHWKARPSPPRCPPPASSRSAAPPTGAPRGLHCGMGACFDCVVTVDGRIGQRACMTKVADGMVVTGDATLPLAPLGDEPVTPQSAGADRATCWSSAPAPPACPPPSPPRRPAHRSSCWTSAAPPAANTPSRSPTATPMPRPTHSSASAPTCATRALAAGARIETEATVWGGFAARRDRRAGRAARAVTFRPRRLILAPGAHERPVPLPGWTLPGVMTTGSLQTLVRAQRVCPGERVLIAGSGPLNLQLACELLAVRRETACGGGGRAAARSRRLASGLDDGAHRARPDARGVRHAADA